MLNSEEMAAVFPRNPYPPRSGCNPRMPADPYFLQGHLLISQDAATESAVVKFLSGMDFQTKKVLYNCISTTTAVF